MICLRWHAVYSYTHTISLLLFFLIGRAAPSSLSFGTKLMIWWWWWCLKWSAARWHNELQSTRMENIKKNNDKPRKSTTATALWLNVIIWLKYFSHCRRAFCAFGFCLLVMLSLVKQNMECQPIQLTFSSSLSSMMLSSVNLLLL